MQIDDPAFLRDREVARILCMSPGWVRNQRWRRRHGKPHILKIDPVMIGNSPRYRTQDLREFVDTLT